MVPGPFPVLHARRRVVAAVRPRRSARSGGLRRPGGSVRDGAWPRWRPARAGREAQCPKGSGSTPGIQVWPGVLKPSFFWAFFQRLVHLGSSMST